MHIGKQEDGLFANTVRFHFHVIVLQLIIMRCCKSKSGTIKRCNSFNEYFISENDVLTKQFDFLAMTW
jgi:hypothetical protein